MASVVWFIAFVGPATQSRRLKFKLMVLLGYTELPCWGVVALVFCVFSRSFQEPGMAVWCTGIGFAAVFLPILALIEAKTMSWYWSGCIKTGLINLDKGLYDQEKPEPEYSSGAPWWLIPSNVGVASLVIGYSCVMVLATVMDIPIGAGDMVTGFALAALAGMIQALFWPMGAGLLLRVIRWERATGRKMLVTPGEDDMEMEGQNAD